MKASPRSMRRRALIAATALAPVAGSAWAQTTAAPARRKVIALVSAVGGELNIVRERMQAGTHMEPYVRASLPVKDLSVDAIVLRGLDRSIARKEPESERVFLRLNPLQLEDVLPQNRERVAIGRLATVFDSMPQRSQWDQIIVATPTYRFSERKGLASKLHGVGVYVRNLRGRRLNDVDFDDFGGEETINPNSGEVRRRSKQYVALYSYLQLWVLDARTLQVISSEPYLFDEKLFDPESTSIDVMAQLTPETLAEKLEIFVQRTSSLALTRSLGGVVEPGELKQVPSPRR